MTRNRGQTLNVILDFTLEFLKSSVVDSRSTVIMLSYQLSVDCGRPRIISVGVIVQDGFVQYAFHVPETPEFLASRLSDAKFWSTGHHILLGVDAFSVRGV